MAVSLNPLSSLKGPQGLSELGSLMVKIAQGIDCENKFEVYDTLATRLLKKIRIPFVASLSQEACYLRSTRGPLVVGNSHMQKPCNPSSTKHSTIASHQRFRKLSYQHLPAAPPNYPKVHCIEARSSLYLNCKGSECVLVTSSSGRNLLAPPAFLLSLLVLPAPCKSTSLPPLLL